MSKLKTFKSSRPRKYASSEEYIALFGGNAECIGKMEEGHRFGEVCKNCNKPFGAHSITGNLCIM